MDNGSELGKIEVKPSTELIPDEYEHFDNSKGSVHIFRGDGDKEACENLLKTLEDCKYDVSKANVHKLDKKKNVEKILVEIARKDFSQNTCFMLFFLGRTNKEKPRGCILPDKEDKEIYIKDVWSKFILNEALKNKPKIFIFQASAVAEKAIRTDAMRLGDSKYDIPVEADLFITYKMLSNEDRGKFVKSICTNICEKGQRDDIIDIVMHSNLYDRKPPLMISTLTRRFFVTSSEGRLRGYHHDIDSQMVQISHSVRELKVSIESSNIRKTRIEQQSTSKQMFGSLSNLNAPPTSMNVERRNSATLPTTLPAPRSRTNSKSGKVDKTPWKKPWK